MKIFVSYSRHDAAVAEALAGTLGAEGFEVWWDRELVPGLSFGQIINQRLREADCVIVIWSAASVASDWVLEEAEHARKTGKLFPVRRPGMDLANVPVPFSRLHSIETSDHAEILRFLRLRFADRLAEADVVQSAAAAAGRAAPGGAPDIPGAKAEGDSAEDGGIEGGPDILFARLFQPRQTARRPDFDPEELPTWDLSPLYSDPVAPKVAADLDAVARGCIAFADRYQNRLGELDGPGLLACLREIEAIWTRAGRITSFLELRHFQDATIPEHETALHEAEAALTEATLPIAFFVRELSVDVGPGVDRILAATPDLAPYAVYFQALERWRPYMLATQQERDLQASSTERVDQWRRKTAQAARQITVTIQTRDGVQRDTVQAALNRLTSPDRDLRLRAGHGLTQALDAHVEDVIAPFNRLVDAVCAEGALRGFGTPEAPRLLGDHVKRDWIDALEAEVIGSYERLSHRFYWLKAGWIGVDRLSFVDRNADLPFGRFAETAWRDTWQAVVECFGRISPELGRAAEDFIRNRQIDAVWRAGRTEGDFAHPTVHDAPKFIMVSHYGNTTDQIRLARMLGHGVHQHLAARQGELLAPVTLPIANTIASFFETVMFSRMLAGITDPVQRRFELAGFVEGHINTIMRQISYYRFEKRVARHAATWGDLTRRDLAGIWLEEARNCVGPAFDLGEEYGDFWCHIPHFVHSRFSTYVYAFGALASNTMFARYVGSKQDFGAALTDMLKAGGSRGTAELLAGFGIDVGSAETWRTGLGVLENMIDALQDMESGPD